MDNELGTRAIFFDVASLLSVLSAHGYIKLPKDVTVCETSTHDRKIVIKISSKWFAKLPMPIMEHLSLSSGKCKDMTEQVAHIAGEIPEHSIDKNDSLVMH